MTHLVPPAQIPRWIPGLLTLDSANEQWRDLTLKGYRYEPQEVQIPAMRDYMIVVYRGSRKVLMRRHDGGTWQSAQVGPGSATILTRGEHSTWHWVEPIDVRHVYIGHAAVEEAAADIFDKPVSAIHIPDQVGRPDPMIAVLQQQLEAELVGNRLGSQLFVDALRTQMVIHLLRRYARLTLADFGERGFGRTVRERLSDYIEQALDTNITISELAQIAGLSPYHFSRKFKATFGRPPFAYVITRRVARAQHLLGSTRLPLKRIASECGFADESHFSRVFRQVAGAPPGEYRRQTQ